VFHRLPVAIADWLFGTSDLDRGLFRTLFNGYSRKYVPKGPQGTYGADAG